MSCQLEDSMSSKKITSFFKAINVTESGLPTPTSPAQKKVNTEVESAIISTPSHKRGHTEITLQSRVQRIPEKALILQDECLPKGTRPAFISNRPFSNQFKLKESPEISSLRTW